MSRHGRASDYNRGCRCDRCTAAMTAHVRRWQKNRNKFYFHDHGTLASYIAGCRCQSCRAANTAYKREYRRRKAEGAAS